MFAQLLGFPLGQRTSHGLEADVLVVSRLGLGGRREHRFRQPVALAQTLGQANAADAAALLVLGPSGSGQIASGHALEGDDFALANEHRPTGQKRRVDPDNRFRFNLNIAPS